MPHPCYNYQWYGSCWFFLKWCPFYRQSYSTTISFSLLTANSWSTCVPSTDITISTLDIGKCLFSRNETSLKQSKSIILKLGAFFTPGSHNALKTNSFIRHNTRLVDINVVLGVFHLNFLNLTLACTNSICSKVTSLATQGLIETLDSILIFYENEAVCGLTKYEILYPISVKIIKFIEVWHHFDYFYVKEWSESP